MKNFLIICTVAFGFMACEKDAGEGGTSIIEGKVIYFKTAFNTATSQRDTFVYPKAGKDVFIIYSNDKGEIYDDNFETDHNGKYSFEYLRKGEYTIVTYVDSFIMDPNDASEILVTWDSPIYKDVKITSNSSTNKADDFMIDKTFPLE